jgi:hypothetical protein
VVLVITEILVLDSGPHEAYSRYLMTAPRRSPPHSQGRVEDVLIRLAGPRDRSGLDRLAVLDSQPPLDTDVLLAEVDGVAVAALSLRTGRLVANPFAHTAAIGDLLRCRAASITPPRREPGPLQRLCRLVPVAVRQL